MNIKEVKNAFKVADVVLDKEHGIRHIKFVFLKDVFDENGEKLNKEILTDNAGRIYLIVVNRKIMKIGKSKSRGGIKSTMSFYQGGMQGGPSIRTYGIHILLKEELEKGKKAEIYMIPSKKSKMVVRGLFDEEKIYVTPDILDVEAKCKKDYKEKEGKYPPWNFQENGEVWRQDILQGLNEHDRKRKSLNRENDFNLSVGKR